jgi:hypothetical protein
MKKLFVGMTLAASVMVPGAASASPPPGSVPRHQHWVVTGNGTWVPVGPNSCEDGQSLQFDNFHGNVHRGRPGDLGVVVATGCPS